MSKIKDSIISKNEKDVVYDSYKEHVAYHQSFHTDCSSCRSERRETGRDYNKMMANPYGDNYPPGVNPNFDF